MATRHLLAALARDREHAGGASITFESVGGFDAARRVASGEPVDLVALAYVALADQVLRPRSASASAIVRVCRLSKVTMEGSRAAVSRLAMPATLIAATG